MRFVALKMLFADRLKYYGLVIGIAFAAMLITQQASILVGLSRQTGAFIRDTSQADLWVMDPQVRFSQDSQPLRDTVLQSTELFKVKPYFLADEFSLVDATIAPVLWRLPYYEIDLPPQAQPIIKYASLIFSRPAFRESLSDTEQEMRLI